MRNAMGPSDLTREGGRHFFMKKHEKIKRKRKQKAKAKEKEKATAFFHEKT
jgi:hypothetical protein